MKTNMGNLVDDISKIKYSLSEIEKMIDNIDQRLNILELLEPCSCLVEVDINKVKDLMWEVQQLLRKK